ncbi:MAG: DUF2185 domain-containing protein [Acidobacteriota bacterium]
MNPLNQQFKIPGNQIRQLIPNMGSCFATDRITVDGLKVGYMFRELPGKDVLSGWTFMSGDESQEYADNPDNWAIYDVNTICNYDPAIIPYLDAVDGSAFGRTAGTDQFEEEPLHK